MKSYLGDVSSISFPIKIGTMILYDIGRIVIDDRVDNYHNNKHIYPVGYKFGRFYGSVVNPA